MMTDPPLKAQLTKIGVNSDIYIKQFAPNNRFGADLLFGANLWVILLNVVDCL